MERAKEPFRRNSGTQNNLKVAWLEDYRYGFNNSGLRLCVHKGHIARKNNQIAGAMMSFLYIAITAISLTYNTYIHYVADVVVFGRFSHEIALQSILDMQMCDYDLQCSIDIAELKVLSKIEVES